mmetsp:Transcript_89598/g.196338  ORF Transcript_89598/g.196338 Transcript_89598/m.196338 type:complete len:86 (-) Transcript_89598:181-438(-)
MHLCQEDHGCHCHRGPPQPAEAASARWPLDPRAVTATAATAAAAMMMIAAPVTAVVMVPVVAVAASSMERPHLHLLNFVPLPFLE